MSIFIGPSTFHKYLECSQQLIRQLDLPLCYVTDRETKTERGIVNGPYPLHLKGAELGLVSVKQLRRNRLILWNKMHSLLPVNLSKKTHKIICIYR